MDRIAIISDIHGNLPALEAVLEDIERKKIKRVFCLGDLAGKGPNSSETVDLVREKCEIILKGNWEEFLTCEHGKLHRWTREKLGEERLNFLKNLPLYTEFYISGKLVRLFHASPWDIFFRTHLRSEKEKREMLFSSTATLDKKSDIIGYGDIHGAHIDTNHNGTIFNTGSVGNPLDIPMASYAIIDGKYDSRIEGSFSITIVRIKYDIEKSVLDAKNSDMPEKEEYISELRTAVYRKKLKKGKRMKALLIVDIQNDFCRGGALEVKDGEKIIPTVNKLIEKFNREENFVVGTMDWHPSNHKSFAVNSGGEVGCLGELNGLPQVWWPVHCVQDTKGAELHKELKKLDLIIYKGEDPEVDSYSGFFDNGRKHKTELDFILRDKHIHELYVVGLATDYCVKFTVIDALELGYKVYLINDGIKGVNLSPDDSEKAIEEMKRKGATIIFSDEII